MNSNISKSIVELELGTKISDKKSTNTATYEIKILLSNINVNIDEIKIDGKLSWIISSNDAKDLAEAKIILDINNYNIIKNYKGIVPKIYNFVVS